MHGEPSFPVVDCGFRGTPAHGSHQAETPQFKYNSSITFSCDEGYNLNIRGKKTLIVTCQADGQWSGKVPGCNGEWKTVKRD